MANAWDYIMKRLVGSYPKQFTSWLLAGATFIRTLDNELKIQSLYSDALLEIVVHGKPALLHVEFQTHKDQNMGRRILEYNILASRQYDHLPTYSIVIYLRKDGEVAGSPYRRIFPDDRPIHNFYFQVIKLWEIQAEMIFQRRFIMFQDILRDSWVYQQIGEDFLKEGYDKGVAQGLEQGLEQERKQELRRFRQMVAEVAQMRFSSLLALAEQKAGVIEDPDALQQLTIQLIGARDADEARELLLQVSKLEEQN